ncbi:unnamed protein product [Zymoseptoria tritici ST99CH_3D1]|nr:unnamed protein product [Zymoseptoria tritici ST99CH_3D1]
MTPEEAGRLEKQLRRYNTAFDDNVDQYCPALVRTKKGTVAKRQPQVRNMGTDYWKGQCSSRGLRTTGKIEDLKDLIRGRDRSKDVTIKQEIDNIQQTLDAYRKQKEKEDFERWWKDPSVRLELKIDSDAERALTELLEKEPAVRSSCLVIQTRSNALKYWAEQYKLACQIVEPPESMLQSSYGFWGHWTVIGRPDLVQQQVEKLSQQCNAEKKEAKARFDRADKQERIRAAQAEEQKRQQLRARRAVLLREAAELADWDITGSWTVECDVLATHMSEVPAELTMNIFRDDFRLRDPRDLNGRNADDEYEHRYDFEDEDEAENENADGSSDDEEKTMDEPQMPRYCAEFNFDIVEGVMRIYPSVEARRSPSAFEVKRQPSFKYIWRGRETGESQIHVNSDETVYGIVFKDGGTSFHATFGGDFIKPVELIGTKVVHGRGQDKSSREKWLDLSESAWNRESNGPTG